MGVVAIFPMVAFFGFGVLSKVRASSARACAYLYMSVIRMIRGLSKVCDGQVLGHLWVFGPM